MAHTESSSTGEPGPDLLRDGFLSVKDADVGKRVEEMETNFVAFASEGGLEFYKVNVLDDPVTATPLLYQGSQTNFCLSANDKYSILASSGLDWDYIEPSVHRQAIMPFDRATRFLGSSPS